jgi:hypothetical protein
MAPASRRGPWSVGHGPLASAGLYKGLADRPDYDTVEVRAALDTVRDLFENRGEELRRVIPTDGLLLVNNHIALHGRSASPTRHAICCGCAFTSHPHNPWPARSETVRDAMDLLHAKPRRHACRPAPISVSALDEPAGTARSWRRCGGSHRRDLTGRRLKR